MAVKYWIGNTSTDATVASNWSTGALPAKGDILIFDGTAQRDCIGDIATIGSAGIHLQAVKMTNAFVKKWGSSVSAPLVIHANVVEIDRRTGYGDIYLDLQETSTAGTSGSTADDGTNDVLKIMGGGTVDKFYIEGTVAEMVVSGSSGSIFQGTVIFADAGATATGEGVATVRVNGNVREAEIHLGPWGTNPRTLAILDISAGTSCDVYTYIPTITKVSLEPGASSTLDNHLHIFTTSDSQSSHLSGTNTSTQITVGDVVTKRESGSWSTATQKVSCYAGVKFTTLSLEGGTIYLPSQAILASEIASGYIDENASLDMRACLPHMMTITDTAAGSSGLQIKGNECKVLVPFGVNVDMSNSALSTTVTA
jgi:hypothetical protein